MDAYEAYMRARAQVIGNDTHLTEEMRMDEDITFDFRVVDGIDIELEDDRRIDWDTDPSEDIF